MKQSRNWVENIASPLWSYFTEKCLKKHLCLFLKIIIFSKHVNSLWWLKCIWGWQECRPTVVWMDLMRAPTLNMYNFNKCTEKDEIWTLKLFVQLLNPTRLQNSTFCTDWADWGHQCISRNSWSEVPDRNACSLSVMCSSATVAPHGSPSPQHRNRKTYESKSYLCIISLEYANLTHAFFPWFPIFHAYC